NGLKLIMMCEVPSNAILAEQFRDNCNDFSIGIELEGTDILPYADAQYATLARLAQVLRARYPLADARGHEHIAPGRKTDPGRAFNWVRFGRESGFPRRNLPPV
ncbi:protein AmpD, partial [Bordetella pertussis H973]|uniref:N-acetylmuramoyl-L-alanine amidase n=1 Tax=Bordetella pertussis TaxID=520 RepID=UPI0003D3F0AE